MTPGFALSFLRASLITFVSIKYTRRLSSSAPPLEVRVKAYFRHGCQDLRETAPVRLNKRSGQNRSMFSLCTATMFSGASFESPDNGFIDTTNQ
jgi:hypothetical protein